MQRVQSTSININESINDYNEKRRIENRSRALTNEKSDSQFKSMYKSRRDELTLNNSQYSIHHIISTHDKVYEGSNDSKKTKSNNINKRGSQQSWSQMLVKPKDQDDALSPILSQVQNEISDSPLMT